MERLSDNPWGGLKYISQSEPPYKDIPFGDGTIMSYGCGACSTANVAMRMGIAMPFADVVSYFTLHGQPLRLFGNTFGIMPWTVRTFFDGGGFVPGVKTSAELKFGLCGYNSLLRSHRYVIPAVKWKGAGAHYVAVMKNAGGGISVVDPGGRSGEMIKDYRDILGYIENSGGGFVMGAIGINSRYSPFFL
jgi:hypothetical protein